MLISIAIHILLVIGSLGILYCESVIHHQKRAPVVMTALALVALNASIYLI